MPFDPNRPICRGDYVLIDENTRYRFGLNSNGPYRVLDLYDHGDGLVSFDLGFNRRVWEDSCYLVEPPQPTLLDRELEAQAEDGWRVRRDNNLRDVFYGPRLIRSAPDDGPPDDLDRRDIDPHLDLQEFRSSGV